MIDTAALREEMEQSLATLVRRQNAVEADLQNSVRPMPANSRDAASVRSNDEVLEALDTEALQRIAELRTAIQRIDEGSYGVCLRCGQDISPARLMALPSAAFCVPCASLQE
jgi:RNA polymerase-binding transcription factor DksA